MLTDHRGTLQGVRSLPSERRPLPEPPVQLCVCGGEQAPSPPDARSPRPLFTSSAPICSEGQARGLWDLAALPWPAPGHGAHAAGRSADQGEDAGGHSQEGRPRGQGPRRNGQVPEADSSERGWREGQAGLVDRRALLAGRGGPRAADERPGPGLLCLCHTNVPLMPPSPHALGPVLNTGSGHSMLQPAIQLPLPLPLWHARHARPGAAVTCPAWAKPGTAGAAWGTAGCGTDGQPGPPSYKMEAPKQGPPACHPGPAPPISLEGESLGKQGARLGWHSRRRAEKSKHWPRSAGLLPCRTALGCWVAFPAAVTGPPQRGDDLAFPAPPSLREESECEQCVCVCGGGG